ncbi:hypothetical protein JW777_06750 [bacterium]|nr:hypothetical protein [bacterium]
MTRGARICMVVLAMITLQGNAALQESLPSWHWAYANIEALQARGGFRQLHQMNRPYTRGDIARVLIGMRRPEGSVKNAFSPAEKRILRRLLEEFEPEIRLLNAGAEQAERLEAGVSMAADVHGDEGASGRFDGVYRSRLAVPLSANAVLVNAMTLDQYALRDSAYIGKKWRGLAFYTEQAYAAARFGRVQLKFGRDFLRWGAGKSGTLLFSDVCRPMDQMSGAVIVGPFRYSFLTAFLDAWPLSPGLADSLGASTARRFLAGHRVDARFFSGALQIGLTEASVYGGVNRELDWVFLNPLMSYHAEQYNQEVRANTLGTVDVLAYPGRNMKLYGSLLIDDIQVEKTGPGDLEPNEIGWLAGFEWSDPFAAPGMSLYGEYSRVTNRTYKTAYPWETAVFRNRPLGHPEGNDFDLLTLGCTGWLSESVRLEVFWKSIRKGEGGLFTPFDTPWMAYTVEEGYDEPFPTGTVERRNGWGASIRFLPGRRFFLEAAFQSQAGTNAGHVKGIRDDTVSWRIGAWGLYDFVWPFGS